jgi:hypothetical protein
LENVRIFFFINWPNFSSGIDRIAVKCSGNVLLIIFGLSIHFVTPYVASEINKITYEIVYIFQKSAFILIQFLLKDRSIFRFAFLIKEEIGI